MNRKILLTAILLVASLPKTAGAAGGTTKLVADTKGKKVVLIWNHSGPYTGYNIYRRGSGGRYTKLNSSPIRTVTSCRTIRRIISPGTPDWDKLHSLSIDPCSIPEIMRNDTLKRKMLIALAYTGMYRIARVIGIGYIDLHRGVGNTYHYALTGVLRGGSETHFLDSVTITVGTPAVPPAPTHVEAYPGDNKVMVRWTPVGNATGYIVERRTGAGSYVRVNESMMMTKCTETPFGQPLPDSSKLCFTDYLRWKGSEPDSHNVNGVWIKGPFNGITYQYRVRAVTMLGNSGSPSSPVSATPVDSTPPQAPEDIHVTAVGESLMVSWEKIEQDINYHKELQGISGYKLYRYTSAEDTNGVFVATVPQPAGSTTMQVTYLDNTPELGSPYEDRVYYYRIITVDNSGNKSTYSAPVNGVVKDITPPDPPRNVEAVGYTDYIVVHWRKPHAPDVAGYQIYRGVCGDTVIKNERRVIYPLRLIGTVDDADSLVYADHGVPKGSPLCYRYAVKAIDKSQNVSDTANTYCEKLRERVAPPPPEIIGLKARNKAVLVQWVSAPVQDLFGFVVERKDTSGTWIRVSPELHFPEKPRCADIQANSIWAPDTVYSFLDTSVVAKVEYTYRVRGADLDGNIGEPSTEVSTYTYDFKHPARPRITSVTSTGTGIRLQWEPLFSPSEHEGFVVFRSKSSNGPYHQISGLIKGSAFIDKNVIHGQTFWYKVQLIDKSGNRSMPSPARYGQLP